MKLSVSQIAGIALVLSLIAVFIVIIEYQEPIEPNYNGSQTQKNIIGKLPEISRNRTFRDSSIDINNPQTCKRCHQSIYNEWSESGHRKAQLKKLYRAMAFFKSDGSPGIPMCENCHISESTLEVTPLAQPVSRRTANNPIRENDGIDCASCHRRHKQIVGVQGSLSGCFAVGDKFLKTSKYCGGCHKTFLQGTLHEYDEWKLNPADISIKKNCNDCHMPDVAGSSTDEKNGTHKSHRFVGGYNKEMILKAFDYKVDFKIINNEPYLILKIINKGTGHHFPTGTAKRRVKLEVTIKDDKGNILGDKTTYLQKPPRYSDSEGTQIPDRESRKFYFPFDISENQSVANIKITYLHFLDEIDNESILLVDKNLNVPVKIESENR